MPGPPPSRCRRRCRHPSLRPTAQAVLLTLADHLANTHTQHAAACQPYTQIRLKEYGGELLEVADNGHGVSPENYQALTLKYHTSKLANFTDLQVGWRGSGGREQQERSFCSTTAQAAATWGLCLLPPFDARHVAGAWHLWFPWRGSQLAVCCGRR